MSELFDTGKGADFSQCGNYRYKLWRVWDNSKPLSMCIGLNPSTANANKNDQTISYLIKMLGILGYGGFYMMNCWALISSDPKKLLDHSCNELICKWNDDIITVTANQCKDIIFCWGGFKIISETGRDKQLIEMFPYAKCFCRMILDINFSYMIVFELTILAQHFFLVAW